MAYRVLYWLEDADMISYRVSGHTKYRPVRKLFNVKQWSVARSRVGPMVMWRRDIPAVAPSTRAQ